jgi:integrase
LPLPANGIAMIRLLDIPLRLIEKYREERIDGKVFPVPGYTTVDINLKRIDEICGINKKLTFHLARHTFATQITLSQGVSMASISKMLGHTSVRMTQIYAKITSQKVNEDMKILSGQMKGKYIL